MIIEKISISKWREEYMEAMYLDVFGETRGRDDERFSFALIAKNNDLDPVGFLTCHEMDDETLYWQYGGATKRVKRTVHVINHYIHFLEWSRERYKRVTTRIENTNLSMLKLALKCGFLIKGVWVNNNRIFLELCVEWG